MFFRQRCGGYKEGIEELKQSFGPQGTTLADGVSMKRGGKFTPESNEQKAFSFRKSHNSQLFNA